MLGFELLVPLITQEALPSSEVSVQPLHGYRSQVDDLSAGSGPLGFMTPFILILVACWEFFLGCALWSSVPVVLLQGVMCAEDTRPVYP